MASAIGNLYQSGETVTISGFYQLVEPAQAGRAAIVLTFCRGERFPTHNSWEVCWYLLKPISEREATGLLRSPSQEYPPGSAT